MNELGIGDQIFGGNKTFCFKLYYLNNTSLFSEDIKEKIMLTINAIVLSYFGDNKSELIMITKLQILFRNN